MQNIQDSLDCSIEKFKLKVHPLTANEFPIHMLYVFKDDFFVILFCTCYG